MSSNIRRLQGRDSYSSYNNNNNNSNNNNNLNRPTSPYLYNPNGVGGGSSSTNNGIHGSFRPATPNSKGQYSDSVMDTLESQNDEKVEGLSKKVKMIKDVGCCIIVIL